MAKQKLTAYSIGDYQRLNTSIEINEEMQAIILPVLTAVENEADDDTFILVRAIQRILLTQSVELGELQNNFKSIAAS
ncbi:hypothetical protein C9446_11175 [Providencia heimbachae]|uniref:hypothetical protein n=1 Tax=Providencia heimbachae TaxID=333962 RepID=UPI0010BF3939|nr:hypothetical protein [Providencia heimbachae]QCJ70366.1 hypothetical protein C9446_11175 [Providencia heimbachae]